MERGNACGWVRSRRLFGLWGVPGRQTVAQKGVPRRGRPPQQKPWAHVLGSGQSVLATRPCLIQAGAGASTDLFYAQGPRAAGRDLGSGL